MSSDDISADDILARYPKVRGNPMTMAALCSVLRKKGLHEDALALGIVAAREGADDIEVRDLVRDALSRGVPPYHAPMLHDDVRNRCYADAIVQWLRIDFGGGIVFENDPFGTYHSCWGAPIFALREPIDTVPGQPIAITARHAGYWLMLTAEA